MRLEIIIAFLTLGSFLMSWVVESATSFLLFIVFLSLFAIYQLNKIDLFWKLYAYFFALISIISSIAYLFDELSVADYLSIPFFIMSSIGVFFFAYKKPFLNRFVWGLVLVGNLVFLYLGREDFLLTEQEFADWTTNEYALVVILMVMFIAPSYIALLNYILYFEDFEQEKMKTFPETEPST